ncbi:MAG: LysR family transcriptional regulator [Firmicutes bacterium]|nr:LysR family transcriptional regulator [Bacillota bacterium]
MNLNTINYYIATVEEMNITHAAQRLFISQQALSNHIARLEEELGVKLFNRSPVLSLTYAGKRFYEYALQMSNIERQIHQMVDDVNENQAGEIRVGISHTCGRAILPSILPKFKSEHPLVDVQLVEENSAEMENALRRGSLDLMIDFLPISIDGAVYSELTKERLFLVVSKSLLRETFGKDAQKTIKEFRKNLDMKAFKDFPFILLKKGNRVRAMLDEYMEGIKFSPNIILETENTETAFALASKGMGITVYPELFMWAMPEKNVKEAEVEFFPIRDKQTTGTLVIANMVERYLPTAASRFIETCKEGIDDIKTRAGVSA